jgi:hypothetical protein
MLKHGLDSRKYTSEGLMLVQSKVISINLTGSAQQYHCDPLLQTSMVPMGVIVSGEAKLTNRLLVKFPTVGRSIKCFANMFSY